jgi:tetratricopeptide (TPR) repeat protein
MQRGDAWGLCVCRAGDVSPASWPKILTFRSRCVSSLLSLQDYGNAEELYKKAVDLDPQHANNCNNFAYFMQHVRGLYQEAESMYKQVSFSFRSHVKAGRF